MTAECTAEVPPAVSVIIPVYNVLPYLPRALDSALQQTLAAREVIAVDDGSTDGSQALCDSYAARYPGSLRVAHQEHGGVSAARNRGLAMARGEYVAFLDSDDYLAADFCERLYRCASAEQADISKGECYRCYPDGRRSLQAINPMIRQFRSRLFFLYYMYAAIYRTAFLREHNLRFSVGTILCEDNLFVHQALLQCRRMVLDDGALYYYCRRLGSADSLIISHRQLCDVLYVYRIMAHNLACSGTALGVEGIVYVFWNMIRNLRSIATRLAEPGDAPLALACADDLLYLCPCRTELEQVDREVSAGQSAGWTASAPT